MGFIIWILVGIFFIGEEIYCIKSKKEVAIGFFFILLGIPLLGEQNSPLMIITLVGIILEFIILIAVYTIKIEGRYRKK